MRLIKDLMTTEVVWVNPTARAKTAVILMKGHNISALPVVHNSDGVVGLVTLQNLLGETQDTTVEELMDTDVVAVDPETTIHNAAELMHETGASHLLVTEDNKLVGIISQADLMPELGRTYDPLTELPWSDTFREWAVTALKNGKDISVILFDLDQFGQFNKKHGHVVGDRVLQAVAGVFKRGIDPNLDLVCRYGGDEFAIVSTRKADEAEALANILQERIAGLSIRDLPEGVSASWGMFGGRRTKEREDVHYAATLDNLITRASKNCIASKKPAAAAEVVAPAAQDALPTLPEARAYAPSVTAEGRAPRLKIGTISFSSSGIEASAGVSLQRFDQEFRREVSGYTVGGDSILRLFAEATAAAVCKSLAPEHGIVVEDASLIETGKEDEIVTVVAIYISPRQSTRLTGSALVRRGDEYRAAAAALLDAVNRQIELAPMRDTEEAEASI